MGRKTYYGSAATKFGQHEQALNYLVSCIVVSMGFLY